MTMMSISHWKQWYGKGSELGKTFEEIKQIYDGVHKKDRLRVCFDTCHVNDAGYDLVGDYDGVFAKFDEVIGWTRSLYSILTTAKIHWVLIRIATLTLAKARLVTIRCIAWYMMNVLPKFRKSLKHLGA